jgi:Phospholipase_D-nuclease N-terminal
VVRPPDQEKSTMLAAADYPFLDVLWTMILFFAWVAWIWIAVTVLTDVYRRHDLSGLSKVAWTVLVIVVPFAGVLIYLLGHSKGMAERNTQQIQAAQAQFDEHVRAVSNGGGAAAEIEKAQKLRDSGTINDSEFATLKAKALAA